MGKSPIFDLVIHAEREIERATGYCPDFVNGPSKGKEFGSAKRIIKYLGDDLDRAKEIVTRAFNDGWLVFHAPSLSAVYGGIERFLVQEAVQSAPSSYLREEEPEYPATYLREEEKWTL